MALIFPSGSPFALLVVALQSAPVAPAGGGADGAIRFEDVTDRAGIATPGHTFGASAGDFDGDGWIDLFVGNHFHEPESGLDVSLFRNRRDGTFEEVHARVLEGATNGDLHGAMWADFDDDGDQDLLVEVGADFGEGAMPNRFYVNDAARGRLVESAARLGVDYPEGRGRTPLWLPWDADARLELLLTTQERADLRAPTALFRWNGTRFEEASVALGFPGVPSSQYVQLSDLDQDGRLDLLSHRWSGPRLLSVGPDAQTSAIARLRPFDASALADSALADLDGDLLPDLLLARGETAGDVFEQFGPKRLDVAYAGSGRGRQFSFACDSEALAVTVTDFQHNRRATFRGPRRHPEQATFALRRADRFSRQDLAAKSPDRRALKLGYDPDAKRWKIEASSDDWWGVCASVAADAEIRDVRSSAGGKAGIAQPPVLLVHRAAAQFVDATAASGLAAPLCARSVTSGDFDNDGDVDLFVVQSTRTRNRPDVLFLNRGDGSFDAAPDAAGAAGSSLGYGDAVVSLDFDRDGFLDLFVTNGEGSGPESSRGRNELFRNLGNGNHWLEIDLVGTRSNRDGIGATVRILAGSHLQLREQAGGMHRYSQDSTRLHFGVGKATRIDDLWVRWPSGTLQHLVGVAADQVLEVREPSSSAPAAAAR